MSQLGEINQGTLTKGLFTEGTALSYPEGATVVDQNFILNFDGTRQRRLGIGLEANAVTTSTNYLGGPTYVYDWNAVGNYGSLNFAVVITDGRIRFYDKSVEPLSDGEVYSDVSFYTLGASLATGVSINGFFVLVGIGGGEIAVFSYEDGTIVKNTGYIKVRDIWGVDDVPFPEARTDTLLANRAYNLANQGWRFDWAKAVHDQTLTAMVQTVVGPSLETGNFWPSNADVPSYGISNNADGDAKVFQPKFFDNVPFGSSPAAKGSAIVRLTNMGYDRNSYAFSKGFGGYTNVALYNDYSATGPKVCASYAGRVFYAGFTNTGTAVNYTYPNLTSTIAFSRSVQSYGDVYKCYQEADPADSEGDIVASDGGTIQIAGSGYIYKLIPAGRSLLVFAAEGVWEIYSTDQLFSATNYQIKKLSDIGCTSPRSIVVAETTPMYFTHYGIYALTPDQVSQSYVAQNITEQSIQSYYNQIEKYNIDGAFGFYDKFEKKVRWLFRNDDYSGSDNFNEELILDIRLQSWYTNVYPASTNKYIAGIVSLNDYTTIDTNSYVYAGESPVVVGTDSVIIPDSVPDRSRRSFKYIVKDSNPGFNCIQFYEHNNTDFSDWGETDAEAVMITGPYTGQDSVRRKSSSYLTMQFNKTETGFEYISGVLTPVNSSSCNLETRWDWTDLSVAGKWNSPIEMYRHRRHYIPVDVSDNYDDGNTVVTTKSRLRGSGRSLALKIYSSPGKDLSILGWNIQLLQNEKV